jgi:hypothetical protein
VLLSFSAKVKSLIKDVALVNGSIDSQKSGNKNQSTTFLPEVISQTVSLRNGPLTQSGNAAETRVVAKSAQKRRAATMMKV